MRRFGLPMVALTSLLFLFFSDTVDQLFSASTSATVQTNSAAVFLPAVLKQNPDALLHMPPSHTSNVIDYDPVTNQVWVVNPDSGSVTAIDATTQQLLSEITVGGEPWSIAIAPNSQVAYVTDKAHGLLIEIDTLNFEVKNRLSVGVEPAAILLHPNQTTAYVTLQTAHQVAVIDLTNFEITQLIPTALLPTEMALVNHQLVVGHLIAQPKEDGEEGRDDGKVGIVTIIDLNNLTVTKLLELQPNSHGFPNLLGRFAVYQDQLWLPHVRSSPDLPNDLTNIVFAAVTTLDIGTQTENSSAFLPLNDQDIFGSPINNPIAAVASHDGTILYVVSAGSDLIEAIDVSKIDNPKLIGFLPTGLNPRGMIISPDGSRGYVMNYLSRSVSVLDLENFQAITDIQVTAEPLAADLLQGKILFNTAKNPKMSNASWVSCASCHPDGGFDGVTWMFPDGPRQTPPIWNAASTLPWHWSAALDEMQDVEDTIQTIQHGIGLAAGSETAPLNVQHAGQSANLDALALFMAEGIRTPSLPPAAAPQTDLDRGEALFTQMGCASCHGGPTWTSSSLAGITFPADPDQNGMIDSLLHDVGTLNERDVKGATGFDVPSLLNVRLTPPYFHDGSMLTLVDVVNSAHPAPHDNQFLAEYSESDLQNLVDFLMSIGPDSPPVAPVFQEEKHEK